VAPEYIQIVAVEKLIHERKSIGTSSIIQELVIKMYPIEILRLTAENNSAAPPGDFPMKTSLAVDWREVTSLLDWIRVHWIASGLSLGGIVSAAGAAVKGLKWFRGRYDGKVLACMTEAGRQARLEHPGMNIGLLPFKIADITSELKRSEKSVYKSLRTLETAGAVLEVKKGEWCLGNRTQKDILDEQWGGGGRFGGNRFNRS